MTSESTLSIEDKALFSPISQLNYEYYDNKIELKKGLKNNDAIQAIVGKEFISFGKAQCPKHDNFADGIDTVRFLLNL